MSDDYFSALLVSTANHLTCGEDLECIAKGGAEWLQIGGRRIDFRLLELEGRKQLVLAFQAHFETLPKTESNWILVAEFSKWFLSAKAEAVSENTFDLVLCGETLLHGNLAVDAASVALILDTMAACLREGSPAPTV